MEQLRKWWETIIKSPIITHLCKMYLNATHDTTISSQMGDPALMLQGEPHETGECKQPQAAELSPNHSMGVKYK